MKKFLLITLSVCLLANISCTTEQKTDKFASLKGITLGLPLTDSLKTKYNLNFVSNDVTFVGPRGVSCDSIHSYTLKESLKGIDGKWITLYGNFFGHPKDGRIYKIYGMTYNGSRLMELFKTKYGNPIDLANNYNHNLLKYRFMEGGWELDDKYRTVILYTTKNDNFNPETTMYFIYLARDIQEDLETYAEEKTKSKEMQSGKIIKEQNLREEALHQDF